MSAWLSRYPGESAMRGSLLTAMRPKSFAPSLKADLHVRALRQVHRINEANRACGQGHHQRMHPHAVAKKADSFQQAALGHAGRGEDDFPAGREFLSRIHLSVVTNTHGLKARRLGGVLGH